MKIIHKFIHFISDFLFPEICDICKERLSDSENSICNKCWESIKSPATNECPYCFVINPEPKCNCLEFKQSGFDGIYSGWLYTQKLRHIIHSIKYRGKQKLGIEAGKRLAQKIKENIMKEKIDIVVCVPTHHTRKRERGYNQTEYIARGFCKETGMVLNTKILKRIHGRKSQTKYTRKERRANIRNAFAVNKKELNKHNIENILVIDDVTTTGVTLEECAKTLKKAGVGKVFAVTVGRVIFENDNDVDRYT